MATRHEQVLIKRGYVSAGHQPLPNDYLRSYRVAFGIVSLGRGADLWTIFEEAYSLTTWDLGKR